LLVYKLQTRQPKSRKSSYNVPTSGSGSTVSSDDTKLSDSGSLTVPGARVSGLPGNVLDKEFALVCRRSMPEPVMALEEADLMSDGMNEIVVLTLKGLHILQVNILCLVCEKEENLHNLLLRYYNGPLNLWPATANYTMFWET